MKSTKHNPTVCGIGYIEDEKTKDSNGKIFKSYHVWRDMLNRCYNSNSKDYPRYGGSGVDVYEPWHSYKQFRKDYYKLAQEAGISDPENHDYHLDKDLGSVYGKVYCVQNCKLIPAEENLSAAYYNNSQANKAKAKTYWIVTPTGSTEEVTNLQQYCLKNGLDRGAMANVVNGKRKTHKGYSLGSNPLLDFANSLIE